MKKSISLSVKIITVSLFFVVFSACGDKSEQGAEGAEEVQSMVEDAPVDDGQGVGKFKDVTLKAIDEKLAEQGKVVFEAKCTACHRMTDKKVVGPGLLGITKKQKPAWILNMITNPEEMTKKDPTAQDLLAEHLTQMTFQDVSDDQAIQILEYLRQNDQEADMGGPEEAKK